ncbi:MAG: 4Fe-4S binding protein [Clostridia bacterium]|nr:4Fe-4S binding protein [Clostridia bacterium]
MGIIIGLPLLAVVFFILTLNMNPSHLGFKGLFSIAIPIIIFMSVYFFIFFTGKVDKPRWFLTFIVGILFISGFFINFLKNSGSLDADCAEGRNVTHFISIFFDTLSVPGGGNGIYYLLILFLIIAFGAALAVGRGWCSFICPLAGIDDCFSRLGKKAWIKNIPTKWFNVPYAILLVCALIFAGNITPSTQCTLSCPSKTAASITGLTYAAISTILILGVGLLILLLILPFMTKKRVFCNLVCPIGKLFSLANKLNVFSVAIDPEKCKNCKKCASLCPNFALDKSDFTKSLAGYSCTRCGRCMDRCTSKAISYSLDKGSSKNSNLIKLFYVYPCILFAAVLTSRMMANTLYTLLDLVF